MATHNIVVLGGDHCGPEVSVMCCAATTWIALRVTRDCAFILT
jgi:hypothetical protein